MTLEQLQQFEAVANLKNYTKAAEQLFISHSTISRNISALEKEVGVALLRRDTRNVTLTPAGKALLEGMGQLRGQWLRILEEMRRADSGANGHLKIASMNFYDERLFAFLKDFCLQYPGVHFLMQYYKPTDLLAEMECGSADIGFAFSFELSETMTNYDKLALYRDHMCVVTSSSHPLAAKKQICTADLQGETCFYIEDQPYHFIHSINQRIGTEKLQLQSRSLPSLESVLLHVRAGQGFTMLPRPIAWEHREGCALLTQGDINTQFDVIMFWRCKNENQSLQLFLDTLYQNYDNLIRD